MPSSIDFVQKWTASQRAERAAAQEHFIDLCNLLGQPTPNSDPTGERYAFEKGAAKTAGGDGWADVWMRERFGWEYKGKHKDLEAAYQQLLQYREDLQNPPLLVVCDLDRFEVHTNFTDTAKQVYAFTLADLLKGEVTPSCPLPPLDVLRALFTNPQRLRPAQTPAQVTELAAAEFATLAESLRTRREDPERAAHFLMRLLFCLFAEDAGLLPRGVFTRTVENSRSHTGTLTPRLSQLFGAMANGGIFGADDIPYFNGGLFASDDVLELVAHDLAVLARASQLDWSSIEPAIFGTLFERSLDPSKRAQLGAHFTSREDILLVVEPVLMTPLRKRWSQVQQHAHELITKRDSAIGRARANRQQDLTRLLMNFAQEIAGIRVLDPACGSGNFLYVALKLLLDLEKEVITFAATNGLSGFFPQVGPEQLFGIEVNAYAHELAQVVVWIGYIQWLRDNGFGVPSSPILKPLHNIQRMDAILARDEANALVEPAWPDADVIVGNPPFLGGKFLRRGLGDQYVDDLFTLYKARVPREADLVTYWFERARSLLETGQAKRAGLLATQSIRAGANRRVLERIKATGDIFLGWSDRPWILEGAAVRVSIVGFDAGVELDRSLDGRPVQYINQNLTGSTNLTAARQLAENLELSFMGDTKGGSFEITADTAAGMLAAPINPNSRPNSDVIRPWVNGLDVTRRPRNMWLIDFGVDRSESAAALYEQPFEWIRTRVLPFRSVSNRESYRDRWWLHMEPRPAMRVAISSLPRFICTPRVAKHRLFVWMPAEALPDSRLYVFARADDYFFGVLHSHAHEVWSLATSSRHGDGGEGGRPTYNNTTCFETFPFPWSPGAEPACDPRVAAIAAAARELVQKRDAWLNPAGAPETDLKTRTLTNLYNLRPTWLVDAHHGLDEAVLDAYGWPHNLSDEQILERQLALNLERAPA